MYSFFHKQEVFKEIQRLSSRNHIGVASDIQTTVKVVISFPLWITFWESSSFVAFDLHLNLFDLISSCPDSFMYWDWEFIKLQPMKVWYIRINKDGEITRS